MNIVKQDLLNKKQFLEVLWSEVWKGGFQLMQILVLLGMYFDAVEVEVKDNSFFQIGSGHTVEQLWFWEPNYFYRQQFTIVIMFTCQQSKSRLV